MPDTIDASLLGRKPSPPDSRDFQLRHFLSDDPLHALLADVLKSHLVPAAIKHLFVAIVNAVDPNTPTPTPPGPAPQPTPDPNPTPPAATTDIVYGDTDGPLDQGNFGTCVGNGWAQWGNTLPIDDHYDETAARAIYYEATVIDGQPDNPDAPNGGQQGSNVRSGAKAMQNRARLGTYAFAASIDEVRAWVDQHGPVVFGTDWTQQMFTPDANGYVSPSDGDVKGGHCYLCVGDLPGEGALVFQNSWGAGWGTTIDGVAGRFKMTYADAASLLAQQGESCASVELPCVVSDPVAGLTDPVS